MSYIVNTGDTQEAAPSSSKTPMLIFGAVAIAVVILFSRDEKPQRHAERMRRGGRY